MPGTETKWSIVALAMSVVAHAIFGGWLATRSMRQLSASVADAEFIFTTIPTLPPEPPEPDEKQAPPARVEREKPAKKSPVRVEPPSAPVPTVKPPSDDAPRDDVPRQSIDLLPSASLALSLDAGVPQVAEIVTPRRQGLRATQELVGELAKETLGRGRVERGLVHSYYAQLGKALLKNWDADRVAASGLKGLGDQASANLKLYNEIWADRAQAYGKGGNPIGDSSFGPSRRAAVTNSIQGVQGVDLEARKESQRAIREQFKAVRRAVIRVVQNTDGKLTKVELVQPSQDAKVDREALIDVQAAAQNLPPPPPDALEGKTELSSLWTFELIVSISPPIPTFSFEFDEALGFIDARLPLDRRIYKKVRLLSVE